MYQLVKLLHPSLSIELSDEHCLVLATYFHVVHLFSKLLNADLRGTHKRFLAGQPFQNFQQRTQMQSKGFLLSSYLLKVSFIK